MAASPPSIEELKARAQDPSARLSFHLVATSQRLPYGVYPEGGIEALDALISILASSALYIVKSYYSAQAHGITIAGIHPLTYWQFMLDPTQPERKQSIQIILNKDRCITSLFNPLGWIYQMAKQEMIEGSILSLIARMEKKDVIRHIPQFARAIQKEEESEKLEAFAKQRNFQEFLFCIID